MILVIDVSSKQYAKLGLLSENQAFWHKFLADYNFSQKLPLEIAKFLKKQRIKPVNLQKIAVSGGNGPFSRTRSAVASANALAFALNIPIIPILALNPAFVWKKLQKIQPQTIVLPLYDRDPNITISKVKS